MWILAFLAGVLAGALWGAIPGLLKAYLNINEVLACIMTNWIAANLVTWVFDVSNLKNMVEGTKTGYIYKTTYGLVNASGDWVYRDGAGVWTPKLGLDKVFPGSQVNAGMSVADYEKLFAAMKNGTLVVDANYPTDNVFNLSNAKVEVI